MFQGKSCSLFGSSHGLRTNVSTCQTLWRRRAAGESAHPCELEAWERLLKCPFQPGAWNKRSREQRPLTGVGKLAERERAGDGNALQCRTPLALGTQRPPPQSRAGSPTRLADRKEPVVLAKHVSGPKTAHTHPASRRSEWSESTHYLTLTETSNGEKQGVV